MQTPKNRDRSRFLGVLFGSELLPVSERGFERIIGRIMYRS